MGGTRTIRNLGFLLQEILDERVIYIIEIGEHWTT